MAYIREICKAGKTIEVSEYCAYRFGKRSERGSNKESTRKQQEILNRRYSEIKLRRLLNTNFRYGDYHLVLNYKPDKRPENKEGLQKDVKKFLRKMRGEYKKNGKELKYIYVLEIGSRGAMHIHLVVNEIATGIIQEAWKENGYIHVHPLDNTGQYSKLAAYLIKYSDKWLNTDKALQGKRWQGSRNLKQPKITKKVIKCKGDFKIREPKKKGYYLDKDSIRTGVHEITGYPYFNYTFIEYG